MPSRTTSEPTNWSDARQRHHQPRHEDTFLRRVLAHHLPLRAGEVPRRRKQERETEQSSPDQDHPVQRPLLLLAFALEFNRSTIHCLRRSRCEAGLALAALPAFGRRSLRQVVARPFVDRGSPQGYSDLSDSLRS